MSTNIVNDARQALGLSIVEMASAMGVHRSTLNKWTRGERKPDNAAVRLLQQMIWLHDNHPEIFTKMLKEI